MKVGRITEFVEGWLLGNFEPSLFRTETIEIAIKRFNAGEEHYCHFQGRATELTVVIEGKIELGGVTLERDEYLRLEPREHGTLKVWENSTVLSVKFPSIPGDKQECSEH